jgi:glycosyltransferase involved in cell wall biosynthesis
MNIVINAFSARLGGGQTYLLNLLAHLPDDQHMKIYIFAPASLALPDDARIVRCATRWPTTNPLLRAIWEALILPRTLVRLRCQLLFCPGGIIATRLPAHCRSATMFRNMLPFDPQALARMPWGLQRLRNVIIRRAMLRSMAGADLTIFISTYARGVIEALIRPPLALTIPHGISPAFRSSARELARPPALPASEYILYVSRFDVYKHQLEVVTAYAMLPQALRQRFKLLLVGESHATLEQPVRALIAARGLEREVIVFGPAKYAELPAFYRHATLNLFASSCENCPNILLEAMGAGRAVLSSSVMPMPEFGADAALYCSPTDPDSIRQGLETLLADEPLRAALGHAAARRSAAFGWEQTARLTWGALLALGAR